MTATNPYKVGETCYAIGGEPLLVRDAGEKIIQVDSKSGRRWWASWKDVHPTESDALTQRADQLEREVAELRERAREAREREAGR